MAKTPEFDVNQAHKYFSAHCFNRAWDMIDKKDRTAEENERMINLAQASIWHWTEREDCTDQNLSIGYWQASRVYSLVGQADNARRYGNLSLEKSDGGEPFYTGYAYEALARAESVAGNRDKSKEYLLKAREYADKVLDPEIKKMLTDDLDTIG
ncbi:MAG: hypothetical protein JSW64_03795 [Candidatus Zixiibacteriota bacterium]|nr:MAG: hypothetical protein JSW64_03795 [candidate division Zixibacteria bacterium]